MPAGPRPAASTAARASRSSSEGDRSSEGDKSSDGVCATFPRPDPDEVLDRGGPDLAVTDLAGARCSDDRVDHVLYDVVAHHNLEAHLRHEVDGVLRPAV